MRIRPNLTRPRQLSQPLCRQRRRQRQQRCQRNLNRIRHCHCLLQRKRCRSLRPDRRCATASPTRRKTRAPRPGELCRGPISNRYPWRSRRLSPPLQRLPLPYALLCGPLPAPNPHQHRRRRRCALRMPLRPPLCRWCHRGGFRPAPLLLLLLLPVVELSTSNEAVIALLPLQLFLHQLPQVLPCLIAPGFPWLPMRPSALLPKPLHQPLQLQPVSLARYRWSTQCRLAVPAPAPVLRIPIPIRERGSCRLLLL